MDDVAARVDAAFKQYALDTTQRIDRLQSMMTDGLKTLNTSVSDLKTEVVRLQERYSNGCTPQNCSMPDAVAEAKREHDALTLRVTALEAENVATSKAWGSGGIIAVFAILISLLAILLTWHPWMK